MRRNIKRAAVKSCSASACMSLSEAFRHSGIAVVGSASERLMLWEALLEMDNTIQYNTMSLFPKGNKVNPGSCDFEMDMCQWQTSAPIQPSGTHWNRRQGRIRPNASSLKNPLHPDSGKTNHGRICWFTSLTSPHYRYKKLKCIKALLLWGVWWLTGRFGAFRTTGCALESLSSRHVGLHVGTFHSQLHVALRRETSDTVFVLESGAPLSSSGLEEAL